MVRTVVTVVHRFHLLELFGGKHGRELLVEVLVDGAHLLFLFVLAD